jgi:uncharacterized protein (DUF302 family)
MFTQTTPYGLSVEIAVPYETALDRTRTELSGEGFGILTEIDVKATLKQKIDVDFRPYTILGACNPSLAHQALLAELDIGLLLPCNVVVHAEEDSATTIVAAIDPVTQLGVAGKPELAPLAEEVRARLVRVLNRVEAWARTPSPL